MRVSLRRFCTWGAAAVACLISFVWAIRAQANEIDPQLAPLYKAFEEKLVTRYPAIKTALNRYAFRFYCNIKVFPIQHRLKDGTTLQPNFRTEPGPDKDGIDFRLSLCKEYGGQLSLACPATFKNEFFTTWVALPYSKKLNEYAYTHLTYPAGADPSFIKSLKELIENWDVYVAKPIEL